MTQSSYPVGYGRPPVHTRFQKGHSGNPGGKPGPNRRLKDEFDEALASALDGNRWDLKDARPTRGVEALARQVVLDALNGRSSAQKIVLERLAARAGGDTDSAPEAENEDPVAEYGGAVSDEAEDDASGSAESCAEGENEEEDEDEDELTDEDRFVFDPGRDMVGDRYDEFKERIERAVNEGDMDALCDAVAEAEEVRIALAAERKRNAVTDGAGQRG